MTEEYISLKQWAKIVALAWRDEIFKNKLELDPRKTIEELKELSQKNESGVELDARETQLIKLAGNIDFERFFDVPPKPKNMSDEEIDDILSGEQPNIIPYLTV